MNLLVYLNAYISEINLGLNLKKKTNLRKTLIVGDIYLCVAVTTFEHRIQKNEYSYYQTLKGKHLLHTNTEIHKLFSI